MERKRKRLTYSEKSSLAHALTIWLVNWIIQRATASQRERDEKRTNDQQIEKRANTVAHRPLCAKLQKEKKLNKTAHITGRQTTAESSSITNADETLWKKEVKSLAYYEGMKKSTNNNNKIIRSVINTKKQNGKRLYAHSFSLTLPHDVFMHWCCMACIQLVWLHLLCALYLYTYRILKQNK